MVNTPPDPDELLARLQDAAGPPPLAPLRLGAPAPSMRTGAAGAAVTRIRGALLRIIAPSLLDLVAQLERDRIRVRSEVADLEARVRDLEARAGGPAPSSAPDVA